jgi:hypothetical protein
MSRLLTAALVVATVGLLVSVTLAANEGGTAGVWAVVFWGVIDAVLGAVWLGRRLRA